MSEPQTQSTTDPAGQQVQLQLDRSKQTTTYVNAFHTQMNTDELILELGLNAGPVPGAEPQRVLVELSERLILSYPTAKRLAAALVQNVNQYEQRFGEIKPPQAPSSAT
ncbi:MAG: DUF3467 domain-containing protein [Planctomycetota bacterium]